MHIQHQVHIVHDIFSCSLVYSLHGYVPLDAIYYVCVAGGDGAVHYLQRLLQFFFTTFVTVLAGLLACNRFPNADVEVSTHSCYGLVVVACMQISVTGYILKKKMSVCILVFPCISVCNVIVQITFKVFYTYFRVWQQAEVCCLHKQLTHRNLFFSVLLSVHHSVCLSHYNVLA